MDELGRLRRQYSSLSKRLDKQQTMLNAYLKGKVPTGRGMGEWTAEDRHNRGQRNALSENSQWTSTPARHHNDITSSIRHSSYQAHTQTDNQRIRRSPFHKPHSRERSGWTKMPEKRKSESDAPRRTGRGSSLSHHGSESKRLRSMERRRPLSRTRMSGASPHRASMKRPQGLGRDRKNHMPEMPSDAASAGAQDRSIRLGFVAPPPLPFPDDEELETEESVDEVSYAEQLLSQGNSRLAATRAREITPRPRSILLTPGGRTKKTPMRVSFLERLNRGRMMNSPIVPLPRPCPSPSPRGATPTSTLQGGLHERSFGSATQPLLGYDWIAGALDNADAATDEQSNAYLEEIKLFRQLNRDECVHASVVEDRPDAMNVSQSFHDIEDPCYQAKEHKCIHNYALNDRLFAVPLHGNDDGESVCAICQTRRSSKQKQTSSPSYIRVSIPRSTLMSPYHIRPHRRQSFDPTDSMGLSQHCLAGWQNSRPSMMPPASSIDLKASLDKTMVAASSLFETGPYDAPDASAGRPLGPSRHTQDLLNRSHALRVDLQRLERAGLSMGSALGASHHNYPLL